MTISEFDEIWRNFICSYCTLYCKNYKRFLRHTTQHQIYVTPHFAAPDLRPQNCPDLNIVPESSWLKSLGRHTGACLRRPIGGGENARLENAALELSAPSYRGWKMRQCGTGKFGNGKFGNGKSMERHVWHNLVTHMNTLVCVAVYRWSIQTHLSRPSASCNALLPTATLR